MERYVRVSWPESGEWMWCEHCDKVYYNDDASVFVPEELYNRINNE